MQLELADARGARPVDRLLEQGLPDPAAAMAGGDHQAEVGDVVARPVRVARDGEATHDGSVVVGDEDRRVGVSLERA